MASVRSFTRVPEAYGRLATLAPSIKVVIEVPSSYVPLKSDTLPTKEDEITALEKQLKKSTPKQKSILDQERLFTSTSSSSLQSFKLHIGGNLSIPSANALSRPQYTPQEAQTMTSVHDPFDGLPFRAFAESLGEKILPIIKATKEEERLAKIEGRQAAQNAEPVVPQVPHILPFTRWAANSTTIRDTFIAEDPSKRKKARLSWYHPDDTMVPRGWWEGGLLADLKYYSPFGLGGGST